MKKLYPLIIFLCWCAMPCWVTAQNSGLRHTFSATAGVNIYHRFSLVSDYSALNTVNLQTKSSPAWGIQYDYSFRKWMSIGVAGAYHQFQFTADQIVVPRELTGTYVGSIDLNMRRFSVGIRPLLHYGHLRRFDMYSGLRLGINIWKTTLEADAELVAEDVNDFLHSSSKGFHFQIIPFGMRYFVTKNIAAGLETGLGAPWFAAFQIAWNLK